MAKRKVFFRTTNLLEMNVSLVCSIFSFIIAIISAETWRLHSENVVFEYRSIRVDTNKFLSTSRTQSDSLIACCKHCFSVNGMVPIKSYYIQDERSCLCNPDIVDIAGEEIETDVFQCVLDRAVKVELSNKMDKRISTYPYPTDCMNLYETNHTEDGVYAILPGGGTQTEAWCDMTNGGWTVIQRRMDGSESFIRGWSDYVHGFGNRTGEYWLGLENMHRLTENGSELIVHIEAFPELSDLKMTLSFANFNIGDENSNYVLNVSGNNASCARDFVDTHGGMSFSTFDNDNDQAGRMNCAESCEGGWWHNACCVVNLNGAYIGKLQYFDGITFINCFSENLKFSVMKIKPTRTL